ncbi:PE-PPE domain-containing protein [[Mycobacterium] burgundiense]|uniref:PE-PPE domain-containing protein n=1 Tax=[Mycobacterium] burgundiense TaxID=3064286 RepID=A0ABM9M4S8_9MYCO|nr:PE-PPE domain-containing protein [Mycolicibacterium sp. MU0053]CAJ1510146.1 PE-PPE domain-containing protein [Mycolicibacterium sp. MU0053]
MTTSVPTPPKLRKAKAAAVTAAAMAATAALTIGGTTAASTAVLADRDQTIAASLTEDVSLSASIGIYPVGPGAQIARMLGAGTPEGALRTLGAMAALIPGEQGEAFRATLNTLAAALEAAQGGIQVLPAGLLPNLPAVNLPPIPPLLPNGINIPALALGAGINIGLPEIAVPALGPAGTYDAVAGLQGDLSTQLLLTVLKNAMLGTDLLDLVPGGVLPDDLAALVDLLQNVPLNVPGATTDIDVTIPGLPPLIPPITLLDLSLFFSSADRIAIIPTFGLGGTNAAITAPSFLNESQFAKTVVLIIPIRNTSRPGGGMLAMLTPLSSLVGINMSNVDGREGNGNVTFWDITAAYDIMSDAPSTVFSPAAWANSVTGAFMPTYLIPQNVEQFAGVIEDIVSGDIGLDTVLQLLAAGNITDLFHIDTDAADGNMYITYDSGNLPLLEPFQFLPRTISYLPGFDISTPGSESFNDFLTQLVAMGYQDVNLTGAGVGEIPTFVRGFDEAGTQAKFWTNPVSFEAGLQAPQALFNALIGDGVSTGLTGNLFNPEAQDLTLFGSSAIGDAVYRNALTVAVAGFVREALLELKTQLNPLFDAVDSNEALVAFAKQLDEATKEADNLLASAGDSIRDLGIDLSGPLMDGNRAFNNLVGGNPAGAAGDLGGLSGLGVAEDQNEGSSTATRATAPADEVADVETQPIPEGSVVTDLFTNTEGLDRAVKVADALNPRKALQAAAADANERVEKRVTKTQNSLRKANERAALVGEKLRDGDVAGAAKQVGANVQNRVDRLKKDVDNGVNKLRGGEKKNNGNGAATQSDNDSKNKNKSDAA